jgi:two-component system invasion response regulator UvrY
MTIKVMLVDDHLIVRKGLRQVLGDVDDLAVVADAADGAEAVRVVRQCMDANQGPGLDVVMLDIAMPGRDGMDVLKQLKAEYPALPVLMLSTYPDKQFAVRCLRAGAAGYLNKSADPDEMVMALRKAAAGGVYLVFLLLAEGQSVSQIAQALSLSPNTVSTYRARILEKTGTRNDVELALYAVRQQVVSV